MTAARREAQRAILVTLAVYAAYGVLRLASPSLAGFGLVAAFYFLPAWMLREHPEWAREDEVGPESPIPPWRRSGWRTALVVSLLVFPPFALFTFAFYERICGGDLGWVQPLLSAEAHTPFAGGLERFWSGQCAHYVQEFIPSRGRFPSEWMQGAQVGRDWGIGAWLGLAGAGLLDMAVGLFAVALPEEVFHRGYLMGALDRAWPPRRQILGARLGMGALISSLLFALGHLVAFAEPARLATFFPALLFAWLWRRSGSLWAPALVHFASNLLMAFLLASLFAGR